jgi:hypothetical protein
MTMRQSQPATVGAVLTARFARQWLEDLRGRLAPGPEPRPVAGQFGLLAVLLGQGEQHIRALVDTVQSLVLDLEALEGVPVAEPAAEAHCGVGHGLADSSPAARDAWLGGHDAGPASPRTG